MRHQNLLPALPGILLAISFHCIGQLSTKDASVIEKFKKGLQHDVEKDNLHGSISAAVMKDDQLVWAGAFGYIYRDKDIPADTTTIYRIGSITKTFTATLLMLLVEEGKVKLDDPAELYLPEIKKLKGYPINNSITIRQLASHTSGLEREPNKIEDRIGPVEEWENKTLACIPRTKLINPPATTFSYSNIGFSILGLVLERAAGIPYIQLVQQKILTPLHMDDTYFTVPDNKKGRLAEGIPNYENKTMKQVDANPELQHYLQVGLGGYTVPCGGLYSTPRDLAKFAAALMGKTPLITPKSFREMQIIPHGGKKYGLGLMILGDPGYVAHNGQVPGYTAQLTIDEQSGCAVILLRNYIAGKTILGLRAGQTMARLMKN